MTQNLLHANSSPAFVIAVDATMPPPWKVVAASAAACALAVWLLVDDDDDDDDENTPQLCELCLERPEDQETDMTFGSVLPVRPDALHALVRRR